MPQAFLPSIRDIAYDHELLDVDTTRRRAVFRRGCDGQRTEGYDELVSTIPLPELVRRCPDLPRSIREAAAGLRWVSVYSVNLGIGRERISDKHWIYFPERNYPFYRAGFPMNFSPKLGRPGCSSLYVEMSHLPDEETPSGQLIERVRMGLEQAGILRRDDEIAVADVKNIYYAYVLFDSHRARVVPQILAELRRRGIYSIGRYGLWEHTSMEDAIAQGKDLAETLRTQQAAA